MGSLAEVPPLAAVDVDGRQHTWQDYAEDVVLLHFWASWCAPCREEMPLLQQMQQDLRAQSIRVLAINVGEDPRRARESSRRFGYHGTVLVDQDQRLFSAWNVEVLPTTILIDRAHGTIRRMVGAMDWSDPVVRSRILDRLNP